MKKKLLVMFSVIVSVTIGITLYYQTAQADDADGSNAIIGGSMIISVGSSSNSDNNALSNSSSSQSSQAQDTVDKADNEQVDDNADSSKEGVGNTVPANPPIADIDNEDEPTYADVVQPQQNEDDSTSATQTDAANPTAPVVSQIVEDNNTNNSDMPTETTAAGTTPNASAPTPVVTGSANTTNIAATPTATPTARPTTTATVSPAATPTVKPTTTATATPTVKPTTAATATPTVKPTTAATATPTVKPTTAATATPTATVKPTTSSTTTKVSTPDVSSYPVVYKGTYSAIDGYKLKNIMYAGVDTNEYFSYTKLNYTEKQIYRAIEDAVYAGQGQLVFENYTDYATVKKVFLAFTNEHPDTFWLYKYRYRCFPLRGNVNLVMYYTDGTTIDNVDRGIYADRATINKQISELLNVIEPVINRGRTISGAAAKEAYFLEFIAKTTAYDYAYLSDATRYNSVSVYGALVKGQAVCGGYADSLQLLCKAAGVNATTIVSSNHAWSAVYINGTWLHTDITWADNGSTVRRQYCDISRAAMESFSDHTIDSSRLIAIPS